MTTTTEGFRHHCQRCAYDWVYTGAKRTTPDYTQRVICPRCGTKVKLLTVTTPR